MHWHFRLIILFCSGLLLLASCDDRHPVRSGFQNPSTFIIVAQGKPRQEEEDSLKRRYQAQRAALLLAQHEMTQKLAGRIILDQEITETRYDRKDSCTLVYTVKIRPENP